MKKVIDFIMGISGDKWAHLIVCLLITTSIGFWDILTFHREPEVAAAAGGLTAFFLSIFKEVRDGFFVRNNRFSGADLLFGIIGAIIGFILVFLLG